jgi:serine/threonine protein kinase/WD40 repeat protein
MIRCLTPEQLGRLLAGQMELSEEEIWEHHLQECAPCGMMFEEYTATPHAEAWRRAALELPELPDADREILENLKSAAVEAGVPGRAGQAIDYDNWFRGDSVKGEPPIESRGPGIQVPPVHARLPNVPGFEIHGELGRGGMGVVYRARQIAHNRPVALKMILAGHQASPEDLGRFHDEAEAISRLRHPHIVQIFEVGQFDHRLYFVLEYVEGGTLADKINGKPLPPRSTAQLVESLARAMHYAHLRGIIHRDLKPANVLLHGRKAFIDIPEDADRLPEDWDFRRYMPKITDFGLAKLLDRSTQNGRTASGDVVGTPNYMAPEQAQGKPNTIGPTTDVYSLGAVLYEMLTGQPPFQGATPMDTLLLVHTEEPTPPRKLVRDIPVNLETICLKCLRKSPSQRYATAEALAEDLRLFLEGLPIQTRGLHPIWRDLRRSRDRLAHWVLPALVFALSVIAGGALFALWARNDADRRLAGRLDSAARLANAQLRLRLAQNHCEQGDLARGLSEMVNLLEQSEADPACQPLRDVLNWNLAAWSRRMPTLLWLAEPPARSPAFVERAKGFELVAVDAGGKTFGVSSAGRSRIDCTAAGSIQFLSVAGHTLAASSHRGVRWWDLAANREIASRDLEPGMRCSGINLSPDGMSLLVRAQSSPLRLLTRRPGDEAVEVQSIADSDGVTAAAWRPGGDRILLGHEDGSLTIASVTPWKAQPVRKFAARVTSVAWLTAEIAVAGCADGQIRFWNTANLESSSIRAHSAGPVAIAVATNGVLLSGGSDRQAKLWNANTGELIASLPHPTEIRQVAFDKDGRTLMTSDAQDVVRVWRMPEAAFSSGLDFNGAMEGSPAVSANGNLIVARMADHSIVARRRNGEHWSESRTVAPVNSVYTLAAPDPEGKFSVTARTEGAKSLVEFFGIERPPLQHDSAVTVAVFPRNEQKLFTGTAGGAVIAWSLANGHGEKLFTAPGPVRLAAISPDQRAILVGAGTGDGGEARVWSLEKPDQPLGPPLRHADAVIDVDWEADGKTVRTRDRQQVVRRWDFETGRQLEPLEISAVAIDAATARCLSRGPNGSLQLIGQSQKNVILVAPADWKCASFSADGRWILTGWSDGVRLWDAATGRPIGPVEPLTNLSGVEFVQARNAILAWSATEIKWLPLPNPAVKSAADWRRDLWRRSGMDWPTESTPRFLDAAEWRRAAAR